MIRLIIQISVSLILLFFSLRSVIALTRIKEFCEKDYNPYTRQRQTTCKGVNFTEMNITELFQNQSSVDNDHTLQDNKFRSTIIKFEDCIIGHLPTNFFTVFPIAQSIHVINSSLAEILKNSSQSIINLNVAELNFSHNSITEISDWIVVNFPMLTNLDLSYNQIKEIKFNNFRSNIVNDIDKTQLSNHYLTTIYFQNNQISKIENGSFDILTFLKILNLNNNKLEIIYEYNFKSLKHLKELHLRGNNIKKIDSNAFESVLRFEIADISENSITDLNISIRTETLYANNSKIATLNFAKTSELNKLLVSNNSIEDISGISELKYLGYVDISRNPIGFIEGNTLISPSLYFLNLSRTNIHDLDYNTFWKVSRILVLDMSYNNLKHFDGHSVYPLQNLLTLFLDGNNLTEIEYEDRKVIRDHLDIGLTKNNWNCSYLGQMIRFLNDKHVRYLHPKDHKPVGDRNIAGIGCWNTGSNVKTDFSNQNKAEEIDGHVHLANLVNFLKDEQQLTNRLLIGIIISVSCIFAIILAVKFGVFIVKKKWNSRSLSSESYPFVERNSD